VAPKGRAAPFAWRESVRSVDPMTAWHLLMAGAAALVAGGVNALAGGGTILTFPTLTAIGVPALTANVTNTVALCPGYLGGTLAQAADLRGQGPRLRLMVPAAIVGGLVGGLLLLHTGEHAFRSLVPYLILAACALLGAQNVVRAWLLRRTAAHPETAGTPDRGGAGRHRHEQRAAIAIAVAAVYGGYFGAGLSVIVLAVLGMFVDDTLTRLNAIKQVIGMGANVAAAVFFLFSGHVAWTVAVVMAMSALAGGAIGGRLARHVAPATLRRVVVTIGVIVGVIYLVR
jgi:uncharacterized membrane protein YfcA